MKFFIPSVDKADAESIYQNLIEDVKRKAGVEILMHRIYRLAYRSGTDTLEAVVGERGWEPRGLPDDPTSPVLTVYAIFQTAEHGYILRTEIDNMGGIRIIDPLDVVNIEYFEDSPSC